MAEMLELGELTTKIGSGATPTGGSSVYQDQGIAFIRSQNVLDLGFKKLGLARISDAAAHSLKGVTVHENDVLINITGDSILRTTVVPPEVLPARVNQHVAILRTNPIKLNPWFLQYSLVEKSTKGRLEALGQSGGTRAAITKGHLSSFKIQVPELEEQLAIVDVLRSLDEKIEANNKLAQTADLFLRELWNEWVIEHDGSPTVRVDLIADVIKNSVEPNGESGTRYLGLEHFNRRNIFLDSFGDSSEAMSNKSMFQPSDTLFGKLRPNFHKVVNAPGAGICSTDILVIRAKEPRLAAFLTLVCSCDELVSLAVRETTGTKMPRANWESISRYEFPFPNFEKALSLSEVAEKVIKSVYQTLSESRALAELRDYLLPRLMSGKITVRDAEKMIG